MNQDPDRPINHVRNSAQSMDVGEDDDGPGCNIYYAWRPNLRDEGDNHLVELAIAGGAQAIVTRNLRDITQMELHFPRLKVGSPEALLQELTL